MSKYTRLILLCLLLTNPLSAYAIDRQARHQTELGYPDFNSRTEHLRTNWSVASSLSSDVKISETTAPAMFAQDNASLVKTKDNSWLAAWQDERLGADKIYLQKCDSAGVSIGPNRLVASSQNGADYIEPKLAVDTSGRIYLFWRDRTDGFVFGSRYNPDLTVDLAPYLVNDTSGGAFAGIYDYDVYPDGRLVAVWENYTIAGNTIQMRIFGPAGATVFGPARVNTDVGAVSHWSPGVAVQPGSGFLVVWEDYRSGNADIMVRLFTGAGAGVAPEFGIVPPGAADAAQYEPRVVYSPTEKYVIGWIDLRNGQEMYLQEYDPISGLVGGNVLASQGNTQLENWDLDLAVSPDGRLLATWGSYGPQASIMAQRFNTGLTASGGPFVLNQSSVGQRWEPSAKFLNPGEFGVAWTEVQNNDQDISFMLFDTLGARKLPSEKTLNDDTQGSPSAQPYVAATTTWWNLVAFVSKRVDQGDIYVQSVSRAPSLLSGNRKVNLDVGSNLQEQPYIATGRDTNLVLWIDNRASSGGTGRRVYARMVTDWGVPFGPEIAVSETGINYAAQPRAAISTNGRILVTWINTGLPGETHVRGRWLTASGQLDGDAFAISEYNTEYYPHELSMGKDAVGRLYAIWHASNDIGHFVDAAWFNPDKTLGGQFQYADSAFITGIGSGQVSAAVNDAGTIALLGATNRAGVYGLSVAAIDRTGTELLAPVQIKDDSTRFAMYADVAIDQQGYISAVWSDAWGDSRRVWYQVLSGTGSRLGANQLVSSASTEYMVQPSADALVGRLFVAWVDPRQDGDNIWGNVVVYQPTDADDNNGPLPGSFALYQNYPNPFNPSTEIRFTLPVRADIRLDIFNLLGQRVTTLVSGILAAGEHRVNWDGTDSRRRPVAGGLYFYRLTGDRFVQTKKMMLVK